MVAALSKGDILFPWDDDDIHLSFRVSQSVNSLIENKAEYYKPASAFFWNNGVIDRIERNNFHAQCCYTRDLFNKTLYSVMGSGQDQDFDSKVRTILNEEISTVVSPDKNFYLYRWAGTNSYHLSSIGSENAESIILAQHRALAKLKQMPSGIINLIPKWKLDYEKQAKYFIE